MTKKATQPKTDQATEFVEKPEESIAVAEQTGPDWSKIKRLDPESLVFRADEEVSKWSVIRELYRARFKMIEFYLSPEGGELSMKEAIQRADKELNGPEFERHLSIVGSFNVNQVSWFTLHDFFITDPDLAEQIWQDIKGEAAKDFIGGHMVAQVF